MFKKILLSTFGALLFMSCKSYADGNDKLKVRADLWCPYNCEPKDKSPGYMVEVLQIAFGKENINYDDILQKTLLFRNNACIIKQLFL